MEKLVRLVSLRKVSSVLHAHSQAIISVGDIVVIKNDSVPQIFWKLAKVEKLMTSNDGVTRSAKVRVMNSQRKRTTVLRLPIQYLVPFDSILLQSRKPIVFQSSPALWKRMHDLQKEWLLFKVNKEMSRIYYCLF